MKPSLSAVAGPVLAGIGVAVSLGAAAQAQDLAATGAGTWTVAVRATGVIPDASGAIKTSAGGATGLNVDVEADYKPTLGITYFLTDRVAAEVILGTTQHEIRAKGGATDVEVHKTWVLPPVASLQYHFAPEARFRPYVGAGLNYMLFYSGKDKNGFKVKVDNGLGYALQAGADIPVAEKYLINIDVKKVFFQTDAKINDGALESSVTLDPIVASVGVTRVF